MKSNAARMNGADVRLLRGKMEIMRARAEEREKAFSVFDFAVRLWYRERWKCRFFGRMFSDYTSGTVNGKWKVCERIHSYVISQVILQSFHS